ncbi:uncharacterized protein [Medicago truncatula]|uniref:uncharacterized protein n=1 Tax=Medicago truncatula TaxID=3880 RepID=UPI0019688D1C|nr:uncharacterized protein LOC25484207 [Medicago truncatula]
MAGMPPPPLPQLGESFASQYYGLLCSDDANKMHDFYSEHSTMILVIDEVPAESATGIGQIRELISRLSVTIETTAIHTLECEENPNGVLLVVSGFVKIKDTVECRKFVHSMYLAPYQEGYFIKSDILHIITHDHQVPHELKPVAPITSKDIDPRFYSEHPPPVTDNGNLDESAVKRFERLMSLEVNVSGRDDLQNQPIVSEPPTAQEKASSSNSSGVANADENMDALEIEEPVAVQEEFSQSDTPTTPTSTGRGGGTNTRERDSGGRDKENMDALDIITHHQVSHELKPVAPPVADNGKLDESEVKRIEPLMSLEVNDIQFPKLQLQPQKKLKGRHDLQKQPIVSETPTAQKEASSSNSSSVANADNTTPENMAVQEEPPQIPDRSNLDNTRGCGSGERVKGSKKGKDNIIFTNQLPIPKPQASSSRGSGNNTRGHDSGGRDNGKKKAEN